MVYFKNKSLIRSFLIECYIVIVLLVVPTERVWADNVSDPSLLTLERIFSSDEFKLEKFGPARWLKDGTGYTTLEDSKSLDRGKDIVRYDPESAAREVLVSANSLIPPCETKPLDINDYSWSSDGSKLLIFTKTKRVWRQNTRGDYWVLDLTNHQLHKLGGEPMSAKEISTSSLLRPVISNN
jgi:hypothetical protein